MPCHQRKLAVLCCAMIFVAAGCTSRWAMNDPTYAAKYSEPYEGDRADKIARMAKQSIDARYVDGGSGLYVGAAGHSQPPSAGAEIGAFHYFDAATEGRAGLALLCESSADDVFWGGTLGVRVQPPSRFAPYAGLGTFAGYSETTYAADDDGVDNDNNGFIDERGERESEFDGALAAVYPEFGAHFWLTSRVRLTASASYYITTQGRDHDFWMYGLNLGYLAR